MATLTLTDEGITLAVEDGARLLDLAEEHAMGMIFGCTAGHSAVWYSRQHMVHSGSRSGLRGESGVRQAKLNGQNNSTQIDRPAQYQAG